MDQPLTLTTPATAKTPALRLRPWDRDDAADMVAAQRDPLLRRWLSAPVTDEAQARGDIDKSAEAWRLGSAFGFCVREAVDGAKPGRLLGGAVVKMTGEFGDGAAQVGYWTVAAARGLGIAPRAVATLVDWVAADHTDVERLELLHTIGNDGSCRVADKCGFALEREVPPFPPQFPDPGHLHVMKLR